MNKRQNDKAATRLTNGLLLHDLTEKDASAYLPDGSDTMTLFPVLPPVRNCIGCFGCWIKTPGTCVIDDRARLMGEIFPTKDTLIVVSRCVYGGVSPDVKAVLERNIGISLPFFRVVGGEMHHIPRFRPLSKLVYHFYGTNLSQREEETARALAAANARNLYAKALEVYFHPSLSALKEALS